MCRARFQVLLNYLKLLFSPLSAKAFSFMTRQNTSLSTSDTSIIHRREANENNKINKTTFHWTFLYNLKVVSIFWMNTLSKILYTFINFVLESHYNGKLSGRLTKQGNRRTTGKLCFQNCHSPRLMWFPLGLYRPKFIYKIVSIWIHFVRVLDDEVSWIIGQSWSGRPEALGNVWCKGGHFYSWENIRSASYRGLLKQHITLWVMHEIC